MSLQKGTKVERGYATVTDEDGVNYRDIAETLSMLGFPMGHSSVRNYILRTMQKFVCALSDELELQLSDDQVRDIAMDPHFQDGIASILSVIEGQRREEERLKDIPLGEDTVNVDY